MCVSTVLFVCVLCFFPSINKNRYSVIQSANNVHGIDQLCWQSAIQYRLRSDEPEWTSKMAETKHFIELTCRPKRNHDTQSNHIRSIHAFDKRTKNALGTCFAFHRIIFWNFFVAVPSTVFDGGFASYATVAPFLFSQFGLERQVVALASISTCPPS